MRTIPLLDREGQFGVRSGSVAFILFYGVAANLPFWLACYQFGLISSGRFCLDFLTVAFVALFMSRVLAAAALFFVLIADILCAVCQTYFLTIEECFVDPRIVESLSMNRRIGVAAVVTLIILVTAVAAYLPPLTVGRRPRRRIALFLVVLATIALSADCIKLTARTGRFPNPLGGAVTADRIDLNNERGGLFTRIPVIRLMRNEHQASAFRERFSGGTTAPVAVPSATAGALHAANLDADPVNSAAQRGQPASSDQPNIVLVLVESWGLARNPALNNALDLPYTDPALRARYDIHQGTTPFYGGTVAGEARELCGNTLGVGLLSASQPQFQQCVPAHLASLGYRIIAVHGMDGHMFERSTWYPTMGFQEEWFHNELVAQGLPDCQGAYNGSCDADVGNWIGRRLANLEPAPVFIHWVTLNSHIPVLVPSMLLTGAPCTPALGLEPYTTLCSWYQLVENVHQTVNRLALGRLGRPTIFIVVGDHAPPFHDISLRDSFSQTDVPYVVLVPHELRRTADPVETPKPRRSSSTSASH